MVGFPSSLSAEAVGSLRMTCKYELEEPDAGHLSGRSERSDCQDQGPSGHFKTEKAFVLHVTQTKTLRFLGFFEVQTWNVGLVSLSHHCETPHLTSPCSRPYGFTSFPLQWVFPLGRTSGSSVRSQ